MFVDLLEVVFFVGVCYFFESFQNIFGQVFYCFFSIGIEVEVCVNVLKFRSVFVNGEGDFVFVEVEVEGDVGYISFDDGDVDVFGSGVGYVWLLLMVWQMIG